MDEFDKALDDSLSNSNEFDKALDDSIKQSALKDKVAETKYVGGLAYYVPTELGEDATVLDKFWYYDNQIGAGILSGVNKAVGSASRFMVDILGLPIDKKPIENFENSNVYEDQINSTTGKVAETISQVGTGLFATRGMGVSGVSAKAIGSRMAQGGIIDGIFFSEKDDNVANVLSDLGMKNFIVDALKVDKESDSPLWERAKSAVAGAGIGSIFEIVGALKYGKDIMWAKAIKENPDTTMAEFAKRLEEMPEDELIRTAYGETKAQMNEVAEQTGLKETAKFAEEAPITTSVSAKQGGEELLSRTEKIIDDAVKANPDNITINTSKVSGTNMAEKVAEDLDGAVIPETHEEVAKRVKDYFVSQIQDKGLVEGYKEVDKLLKATKGLNFKVEVAKTVVASVFKDFDNTLTKYRQEPSSQGLLDIVNRLENLDSLVKMNKKSLGRIAQALSQAGFETQNAPLVRILQVADAIDPESKLRILKEVGDITDPKLMKIIQGFADESISLQDALVGIKDGRATKFMNFISEQSIAGMLSGFSTLSVGLLGSGIMRSLDVTQDLLKYGFGVGRAGIGALRGQPVLQRMQYNELKALIHSNTVGTVYDLKDTFRMLKSWFDSGFKDDTFDRAMLSPMIQDQPTHKQYITAEYLRGSKGIPEEWQGWKNATNNLLSGNTNIPNLGIDIYGKIIRSPYKAIAIPDDWMKRGFFRNELVRQGYQLVDHARIPYDEQAKWVDNFIKANTEIQLLRNNNKTPTKEWAKNNMEYLGKGENKYVYADLARERANYGTFQSEITGWAGKAVDVLNYNGLLRVLVPFKTTTLNLIKVSYKESLGSIGRDIIAGGVKGDLARAKATIGVGLMWTAWSLADSGKITGTFLPKERSIMESSGFKENTWINEDGSLTEYKQLEPLATILSLTTDLNNMVKSLSYRFNVIPEDQVWDEAKNVSAEFATIIANNITNKTFTKSLADNFDFLFGKKPISDLLANVINSSLPMGSGVNFTGRILNHDGTTFEAKSFLEKAFRNYRVILDRPALNPFGEPIDEVSYNPLLLKQYKFDSEKNRAGIEMSRLGIDANIGIKSLDVRGLKIDLDYEELHDLISSLDTKMHFRETMNDIIDSKSYQDPKTTDFVRREMLETAKAKIHNGAIKLATAKYTGKVEEAMQMKIDKINTPHIPSKYDGIIDRVKGLANGQE